MWTMMNGRVVFDLLRTSINRLTLASTVSSFKCLRIDSKVAAVAPSIALLMTSTSHPIGKFPLAPGRFEPAQFLLTS